MFVRFTLSVLLLVALLVAGTAAAAKAQDADAAPEPDPGDPPQIINDPIEIWLDLIPERADNLWDVTDQEPLQVVIYGSDIVDAAAINVLDVILFNAAVHDCPGIHAVSAVLSDVGGPPFVEGAEVDLSPPAGDGRQDLILRFACDELVAILGEAGHGARVPFALTGQVEMACGCIDFVGRSAITVVDPAFMEPAVYLPLVQLPEEQG